MPISAPDAVASASTPIAGSAIRARPKSTTFTTPTPVTTVTADQLQASVVGNSPDLESLRSTSNVPASLGELARSVRDLALSYDLMQGPEAPGPQRDPGCAQRPLEAATRPSLGLARLEAGRARIGLGRGLGGNHVAVGAGLGDGPVELEALVVHLAVEVNGEPLGIIVPPELRDMNVQKGQRLLFKIEVSDKGILKALDIKIRQA